MNGKIVEYAVGSVLAGGIAFAASLGFSSPKEKLEEHDRRINAAEVRERSMSETLVRVDQKLDDLMDGLEIRPRRRR